MPATNWSDEANPGEEERFANLARALAEIQRARGHGERALHAKMHAGLRARVRVRANLPQHLRQGLFARAGEYLAYVRFSNGSGAIERDLKPDLRGLAIKVLGVDGPKVLGQGRTQDFLLVDAPALPFRSPDEFVRFVKVVAQGKRLVSGLVREFGLRAAIALLARVAKSVKGGRVDVADLAYYGPSPIALGPYAARLSAVPWHPPGRETRPGRAPDYLGERLRARVRASSLEFELRAQMFEGPGTPLDDLTVPWTSPFEAVGDLTIEPQEPSRELAAFVASLSFDPFHALLAHRPLGATMRARKQAYFASVSNRGAREEPDGSEWHGFAQPPSAKEQATV